MNLVDAIRSALVPVLTDGSWSQIESDHARVKLAWRPDLEPGWGKPRYVERVLADLPDSAVIDLATRCLATFPDRCGTSVQNALWHFEVGGRTELSPITRRALADWFDGRRLHQEISPTEFLRRFAAPGSGAFGTPAIDYNDAGRLVRRGSLDIDFYAIFGGADEPEEFIGHNVLFDVYAFSSWPDKRVFELLEALVEPTNRRGTEQREWVTGINAILVVDGFELREHGRVSGHPRFRVERRNVDRHRSPKNLIFASNGPKPELGFSSALDNDVVILRNGEYCLLYDDPIGDDGLTWPMLVAWWARLHGLDDGTARKALGTRLMAALASPPEVQLLKFYFRRFAPVLGERLPALLPQVYLHYDPATRQQLRQQGLEQRFLVQRMDFLMLLRNNVRVVIEVDGQQHYSTGMGTDAKPSPRVYADTTSSDRDLRLAGYEVYRFSGAELLGDAADATTAAFFHRLFQRHGITL